MSDLDLARRHAPVVYFDAAEPFTPELLGYAVLREPGPSPSFDRYLNLALPGGRRAGAVAEYALWTDWDIGHLYELEHVWSYVGADGELLHAEASWHGGYGPLVQDGQLSREGARPVAYAQPGKHAMAPTPEMFSRFDLGRLQVARSAQREAGTGGLLVRGPIAGRLEKTPRRDALANGFLRRHAFRPTFRFSRRWDGAEAPLLPVGDLVAALPSRLEGVLHRLEVDRGKRNLWAVLFDLGDTLMDESTEVKDASRSTVRADLFPGAAETLRWLRKEGYLLGLVADTRPDTHRNVLRQHDLEGVFDVLAISEQLGCEKPDRRIFEHALAALGLRADEAGRVAMVGNNLARDVHGANAAGLRSVWLRFNDRYPTAPAADAERPHHAVTSFAELRELIGEIG